MKEDKEMTENKEMTEKEALRRLSALCARSEHCTSEMYDKMRRWGMDEEAQQNVVGQLVKARYVDDERYARAFANDKVRYNRWGRKKIEQALYMKRISEDIRQRVLSEISEESLTDALTPLLKSKMKSIKAKDDYELTGKLIRFAMGKGYGYEEIKKCLSGIISCDEY